MGTFNWGAFFRRLQESGNPRPPGPPQTGAELAASARQLQAALPSIIAWLDANPDAIRAADGLLQALRAGGLTWAASAENAVNAVPSALHKAEDWLPTLIGLLGAFQPAPRGGPPITEGDWGRSPQPVDNPSGAIGGGTH